VQVHYDENTGAIILSSSIGVVREPAPYISLDGYAKISSAPNAGITIIHELINRGGPGLVYVAVEYKGNDLRERCNLRASKVLDMSENESVLVRVHFDLPDDYISNYIWPSTATIPSDQLININYFGWTASAYESGDPVPVTLGDNEYIHRYFGSKGTSIESLPASGNIEIIYWEKLMRWSPKFGGAN